ncbi:MAG: hypothetical protein ACR2F8_02245 [Caulobacteraceae bacterium]
MPQRMVRQVLFYRAGEVARASHQAGFVVLGTWVRTETNLNSGQVAGDETFLDFQMLPVVAGNPAAISADEVVGSLAPLYGSQVAS